MTKLTCPDSQTVHTLEYTLAYILSLDYFASLLRKKKVESYMHKSKSYTTLIFFPKRFGQLHRYWSLRKTFKSWYITITAVIFPKQITKNQPAQASHTPLRYRTDHPPSQDSSQCNTSVQPQMGSQFGGQGIGSLAL